MGAIYNFYGYLAKFMLLVRSKTKYEPYILGYLNEHKYSWIQSINCIYINYQKTVFLIRFLFK